MGTDGGDTMRDRLKLLDKKSLVDHQLNACIDAVPSATL